MSTTFQQEAFLKILSEILDKSKEKGITARELAIRVGIAPETLSRMKSKGRGDFGVLNKMATIVGLRLGLVPDDETLESIRKGDFF